MDYEQIEDQDQIRFSWNVWPPNRVEGAKLVVPISALYSPLKKPVVPLPYEPSSGSKLSYVDMCIVFAKERTSTTLQGYWDATFTS
ncbi:hypothetical protein ROZALSC1DRAFT_27165 [Rozella allomycis CSF55]|uniref:Protein transport protein SEC23 n=1 Tax=Rozella allomycis (strain CSF55) TaxID=988480 RepID=A0A075AQU4_ROZAC|nr:hypothetical protein O9G_002722 [Rozella allomycis CSF55]RKP21429.1 hypothetical protein ROZALSC1DRAFT_27165 [Rozella allomycis CSF55]|eukprot:EPZ32636.1 hypothetical protein O9G_002722 [Rozella allomycis CSF55]